ncbi:MAG: hypothetical protein KDC38_21290, partial [Planctomycetes bacterium]|nr:hypothetical protein [Planctomycetota bacterium]
APDQADTPLVFVSDLGEPMVATTLTVAGQRRIPVLENGSLTASGDPLPTGTEFVRGDFDANGMIDISDPVNLLGYLFASGTAPTCDDAADVNDDGLLGIDDAIYLLSHAFGGGPDPLPPFDGCGEDPSDDALGCDAFASCP